MRFEEELERSERYAHPTSVVVVRLEDAGPATSRKRSRLNEVLAWLANDRLRITDMPGVIDTNEYAVFMPQTDRAGAEVVAERLRVALEEFAPRSGVAAYPVDGATVAALLEAARPQVPSRFASVIEFPAREPETDRETPPTPDG
jgi:hypothetical protein